MAVTRGLMIAAKRCAMRVTLLSFMFLSIICGLLASANSEVRAAQGSDRDPGYLKEISALQQDVDELKTLIMEQEDPLIADLQEYLYKSLFLVYTAKIYANSQLDSATITSTNDLKALVGKGFLTEWPGNPFNNWAPMEVLSTGDGFSAGDLCMDLCPASEYTPFGSGLIPVSFNLYVYGADESMAQLGSVSRMKENESWTEVPEGALYGLSYHMMSQAEHEAALEVERKLRAEQEKQ